MSIKKMYAFRVRHVTQANLRSMLLAIVLGISSAEAMEAPSAEEILRCVSYLRAPADEFRSSITSSGNRKNGWILLRQPSRANLQQATMVRLTGVAPRPVMIESVKNCRLPSEDRTISVKLRPLNASWNPTTNLIERSEQSSAGATDLSCSDLTLEAFVAAEFDLALRQGFMGLVSFGGGQPKFYSGERWCSSYAHFEAKCGSALLWAKNKSSVPSSQAFQATPIKLDSLMAAYSNNCHNVQGSRIGTPSAL